MISSEGILYIEPSANVSSIPVVDEFTRKMTAAFRQATESEVRYRGWHTCRCGAASSNCDYLLPNGEQTNSLCVHYLAYHREEIPQEQLDKVAALACGEADPNEKELFASPRELNRMQRQVMRGV